MNSPLVPGSHAPPPPNPPYTNPDVVDVTYSHLRTSKQSRIMSSLVDMLSIACGLMMSNNLSKGESILRNKTLDDNLPLFRDLFEIGRRYKIMNPTKMRNTYGKMMYLLMDTKSYQFELKDLNFVKDILTVPRFLSEKRCPAMAEDPLLARAAGVELGVTSVGGLDGVVKKQGKQGGEGDTDSERQKSKSRAEAKQLLEAKYATELLRPEDIDRVVQSVMDNQAYLEFNVCWQPGLGSTVCCVLSAVCCVLSAVLSDVCCVLR